MVLTFLSLSLWSQAFLQPYKDDLFRHGAFGAQVEDLGWVEKVYYDEIRDVNGRDLPQRPWRPIALPERVDRSVLKFQKNVLVSGKGGVVDTYEVRRSEEPKFAVIFIHGAGGDKELGVKDETFGGNFNRLKHLAVRNGGVYYSPTSDFTGPHMEGLLDHIQAQWPGTKTVVACGSYGGEVCNAFMDSPSAISKLQGLIYTGTAGFPENPEKTQAFRAGLPIMVAQGSRDGADRLLERMQVVKELRPDYPSKFYYYEAGGHGTPIRMIDWKAALDWMLTQERPTPCEGQDSLASLREELGELAEGIHP